MFSGKRFLEILGFSSKNDAQRIKTAAEAVKTDEGIIPTPHSIYGSSPNIFRFIHESNSDWASIHFLDGRRKIDESRDLTILVPLTDEVTPVEWDDVTIAVLSPGDLDVTPEEGGIFEELPAPANRAKNYKKWRKDFITWVYRNQKLEIWKILH